MIAEKITQEVSELQDKIYSHNAFEEFLNEGSVPQYIEFLKTIYGFFKPLEIKIDSCIDLKYLPDYHQRRNSASILRDLKLLKVDCSNLAFSKILPQIENTSQAMGALYIIEHFLLEYHYISDKLKDELAITESNGGLFFKGYGDIYEIMWNIFLESLNYYVLYTGKENEVKEAVIETYKLFYVWLQKPEIDQ